MVMGASGERLRRYYTEDVSAYAAGQRGTRNPYYVADGGPRARAEARLWMTGWLHNAADDTPATVPGEDRW